MLTVLTKLPYFDQYINNNSPKYLIDHREDYSNEEYQYRPKGPVINDTINIKETH